jgi:hypothetical protein
MKAPETSMNKPPVLKPMANSHVHRAQNSYPLAIESGLTYRQFHFISCKNPKIINRKFIPLHRSPLTAHCSLLTAHCSLGTSPSFPTTLNR